MTTLAFPTFALIIAACACALWYVRCLYETTFTRSSIVDLICALPMRSDLISDFERVTIESHFRAVLTLRDPLALYSNNIRKLVHEEAGRDYS